MGQGQNGHVAVTFIFQPVGGSVKGRTQRWVAQPIPIADRVGLLKLRFSAHYCSIPMAGVPRKVSVRPRHVMARSFGHGVFSEFASARSGQCAIKESTARGWVHQGDGDCIYGVFNERDTQRPFRATSVRHRTENRRII